MVTMASTTSPYLLRGDFVDFQNRHDKSLNDELFSIRDSIEQVKDELKEFKDDVKEFKDDVKKRFDDVNQRFDELKADNMRTNAFVRNNALRNPILPIRPIVAFHPARGVLQPDPTRFPRHADAFYALRFPTTPNHHRMLAYLVSFYDIHVPRPTSSADSDDEPLIDDPDTVVDQLESILGLNEDNFVQFRQRAAQLANQPRPSPVKRTQIPRPEDMQYTHRLKQYKADAQSQSPKSDHSDAPASTRLGWGTRSTTSSQRPSANPEFRRQAYEVIRARQRERANRHSEDDDDDDDDDDALTSTNTNTNPREPDLPSP